MPELTPAQCRAARALLGWPAQKLAEKARLEPSTIAEFESGLPHAGAMIHALRYALERAGVEFIPENGGGAGVRLRNAGAMGDPAAAIKVEDLTSENDE